MGKDYLYPLRCIHGKMHDTRVEYKEAKRVTDRIRDCEKAAVFYVFTPTHENLGDHAIAMAGKKCIQQIGISCIEITLNELALLQKFKLLRVMNGHPIIVNGGGNIGTLWPKAEILFRNIISSNPNSAIVCLPNTAYFENSEKGQAELAISKKIYNAHPALYICAREKKSYDILKGFFENTILVPDMVLSLDESKPENTRKGCLLCLRRDIERTRTDQEDEEIKNQAELLFGSYVCEKDTCIGYKIPVDCREKELNKLFESFRCAELVITDRLHGMIFAAITGTPCVVLNSKSHKVRGCYEWIKHLDYIRFAENPGDIAQEYARIPKKTYRYDNCVLQPYYEELKTLILELTNSQ